MVDEPLDNREEIGRKGGMAGTSTIGRQNEPVGQKVKEGWMDFKAKVRQKWNQLTDKDIDTYQGRDRNAFIGYVHGKVGGDKSLVERDVDTFARDTNYRW